MNNRISIARSRLLLDHPFFGVLALRMQVREDSSIPTLATDGINLIYNPAYIEQLDMKLVGSAIAHEVMHCVLDHVVRRGAREPRRWNVACDYVANPILKEAGLPLAATWLYNPAYIGKSADEVYNMLPPGQDDSGDGDQPEAQDQILPPPPGGGGSGDGPEAQALEWKLATVQAAKIAQGRGSIPASLKKILEDILTPELPWRETLARFMTERVKDDYSWRRPNPFYAHSGIYLPSMDGVGMGEVVIALDTSGSVLDVIDEFGATVKQIIAAAKPRRTHVIYCDASVNRVDVFEQGQELTFTAVGGGGTDFRPVFEHVTQNNITPACLLYLTDMYGAFPDVPPGYPVMWCATSDVHGPFGETLRIKNE